jgi:hypothetical protein
MRLTEPTTTGLYLEPCTLCSLDCALCYTAHAEQRLLPAPVIQRAVELMVDSQDSLGLFWCGLGEVFEDARFVGLLEDLDARWPGRLLHMVQTNGQTERDLPAPANKVALVSLDLPRAFQERHRGRGSWDRAVAFAARHLAAGGQGVGVKCLLTRHTLPSVGRSFHALQRRLSELGKLSIDETRRRSWLEPIVPFPRRDVARIDSPAFVPRGGGEDPRALMAAMAQHLPAHHAALEARPRTLEISVTAEGVFSCCEAVVPVATHAELGHMDREGLLRRLAAAAPACSRCPLEGVC